MQKSIVVAVAVCLSLVVGPAEAARTRSDRLCPS